MNQTSGSWEQSVQNRVNLGLLPVAVLAGSMNLILFTYSVKFFRKHGSAPNAIIASLTIADSLQTLVASPMLIYFKALQVYRETEAHCKFISTLLWLGKPASALNLTLLSLDKLVWMKREFLYPVIMSRRKTLLYISLCWAACLLNVIAISVFGLIRLLPDRRHDADPDGLLRVRRLSPTTLYPTRPVNLNLCDGYDQEVAMGWYVGETLLFAVLPVSLAAAVTGNSVHGPARRERLLRLHDSHQHHLDCHHSPPAPHLLHGQVVAGLGA